MKKTTTTNLEWFLTPVRLLPTSVPEKRDYTLECFSDRARLLTSNSLRRLQAKAQVFSLEENPAVRTRLTHTLEAVSLGGILAHRTARKLIADGLLDPMLEEAFRFTAENGCLAHDIGNPPFGHFGEYAIRDWFRENRQLIETHWSKSKVAKDFDKLYADFLYFDGNAQGFRTLTRLQWHHHNRGLNLTCSLLAAFLKYLGCQPDGERGPLFKKAGFFFSEKCLVEEVHKNLKLLPQPRRHPIAYIVEAADDVAYSLSDIEDGIEKEIVHGNDALREIDHELVKAKGSGVKEALEIHKRLAHEAKESHDKGVVPNNFTFIDYKIRVTQTVINRLTDAFVRCATQIQRGAADSLISCDPVTEALLNATHAYAKKRLYRSKPAVDVELHGSSVIRGLLEGFSRLLLIPADQFQMLDPDHKDNHKQAELEVEKRLFSMMPSRYCLVYQEAMKTDSSRELYHRIHLIVDFISGMTDSHAVKVFKLIEGISIGNR